MHAKTAESTREKAYRHSAPCLLPSTLLPPQSCLLPSILS